MTEGKKALLFLDVLNNYYGILEKRLIDELEDSECHTKKSM